MGAALLLASCLSDPHKCPLMRSARLPGVLTQKRTPVGGVIFFLNQKWVTSGSQAQKEGSKMPRSKSLKFKVEATAGIEPAYTDLQSAA
jgi:hypothetical protein